MDPANLAEALASQQFANGYELVDGVAMHAQHGTRFQIPHAVLKKYLADGHFVELRVDSSRFSAHPDAPANCTCPHCDEEAVNPILSHEQPASLLALPRQNVPSRGWGEDFWAQITDRDGDVFRGRVDNPLYEARLHEIHQEQEIYFHADHILAVHPLHREELVLAMEVQDLKILAQWLGEQRLED